MSLTRRGRRLLAATGVAAVAGAGALALTVAPTAAGLDGAATGGPSSVPAAGVDGPGAAGTATEADPAGTAVPAVPTAGVVLEPAPGAPVATDEPVSSTGGDSVTVVLTYLDWAPGRPGVEAGGLVSGVVEGGGTCTLVLTDGADTVTTSSPGLADAASTVCGGLTVDGGDLVPGTWQGSLEYSSASSSGVSVAVEVEVPGP